MNILEGVEVIAHKVLRDIGDLVSRTFEAESLSHLSSLVCASRSERSLHEAVLKISTSTLASSSREFNKITHLVRLALLVVEDKETELALGILLGHTEGESQRSTYNLL